MEDFFHGPRNTGCNQGMTRGLLGSVTRALASATAAGAVAVFLAAPWLDPRLVWCEWLGVAVALLLIDHVRGWRGEAWTLASAVAAIAIAFHWAPQALAAAMNADERTGLLVATPLVLWDAARLAMPIWFAARITRDPRTAWLPAALTGTFTEAFVPAVFPWKLGYAQVGWPVVIQSVDLLGPESATFVLHAHAGAIAWLIHTGVTRYHGSPAVSRGRPPSISPPPISLLAIAVCAANLVYGSAALNSWDDRVAKAATCSVLLVQANPEDEDGIDALRRLTRAGCSATAVVPDLVCWPECSGGSYEATLDSLADADRVAGHSRAPYRGLRPLAAPACPLLFGGKTYRGHPDRPESLHQTGILIDTTETIRGRYHKRHLMPFGEYLPGSGFVPEISLYFPMADEFTAGSEPCVLQCGTGPRLGVMLCYEDMVPEAAHSLARAGAAVLVSLINGSAFTQPLTLAQHRMLAQLRAVECRRCLLRCAATGETCLISPTGRVLAMLEPQTRGVLAADVPLLDATTPAIWIGNAWPAACGGGALALALGRRRRGHSAG